MSKDCQLVPVAQLPPGTRFRRCGQVFLKVRPLFSMPDAPACVDREGVIHILPDDAIVSVADGWEAPPVPTDAQPGSKAKVDTLAARFEMGCELWHPADSVFDYAPFHAPRWTAVQGHSRFDGGRDDAAE